MKSSGTKSLAAVMSAWLAVAAIALGQSYQFSIPRADVTVTIEPQGSALIHYKLTFLCASGAHAIDVVDIGMPGPSHEPCSAAIDGTTLAPGDIRKSTYIDNGYEIQLGRHTILPGQQGVFEFTARCREMVWQDTTSKHLASFRFTPTWFGAEFVKGDTDLVLRYILPPGPYQKPDRMILWHKSTPPFQLKGVLEGELAPSVAWAGRIRMTGPHIYGVSFPKAYVSNVRSMRILRLLLNWFSGNQNVRIAGGITLLVAFTAVFFYATKATGCAVYLVLLILIIVGMYKSPAVHLALYPGVLILGAVAVWYRQTKKLHYLPASISKPGGRVHSSLGAVEAAILLDRPVNHILTIMLFEFMRRGLIEITTQDPLTVKVLAAPHATKTFWTVQGRPVPTTIYETAFLEVLAASPGRPVAEMKFDAPFVILIAQVKAKLKDCDLKRSREYSGFKVEQAWKRVREEADFEVRTQNADRDHGWLMGDTDYQRKWQEIERHDGYRYQPNWYCCRHYSRAPYSFPGGNGSGSAVGAARPQVAGQGDPVPAFSDVIDSISGRLKNIGSTLDKLPINQANSIDLSVFDKITSEAFKAFAEAASSGGGGGRSGGGCACACAGCACACACAGGGR
jgi:hypothetical protein